MISTISTTLKYLILVAVAVGVGFFGSEYAKEGARADLVGMLFCMWVHLLTFIELTHNDPR